MQESLFPPPEASEPRDPIYGQPYTLVRNSDPETSKTASKKVLKFRGDHHRKILQALDFKSMTGKELSLFTGLDFHQVMRRMHELEPMFIVKTGRKRENSMEYRKV